MARGKYAVRAESKRENAEVQREIESRDRQILLLRSEVRDLEAAIARLKSDHSALTARLVHQVEVVTSEKVESLNADLESARAEVSSLRASKRASGRLARSFIEYVMETEHVGTSTAMTRVLALSKITLEDLAERGLTQAPREALVEGSAIPDEVVPGNVYAPALSRLSPQMQKAYSDTQRRLEK